MDPATGDLNTDDDPPTPTPPVSSLEEPADAERKSATPPPKNKFEKFLRRELWQSFLMPLLTNAAPIIFASYVIGFQFRAMEFQDKIKAAGILAHVEIIKGDYILLRALAMKLRRLSHGIDANLVARSSGETVPANQDEALKVLAELDDTLYVIRTLDDRSVPADAREFADVIAAARLLAQQLHKCLSPVAVTDEVRSVCKDAVQSYRHSVPGEAAPALALHLVDNTMRVVRYQFAPAP